MVGSRTIKDDSGSEFIMKPCILMWQLSIVYAGQPFPMSPNWTDVKGIVIMFKQAPFLQYLLWRLTCPLKYICQIPWFLTPFPFFYPPTICLPDSMSFVEEFSTKTKQKICWRVTGNEAYSKVLNISAITISHTTLSLAEFNMPSPHLFYCMLLTRTPLKPPSAQLKQSFYTWQIMTRYVPSYGCPGIK